MLKTVIHSDAKMSIDIIDKERFLIEFKLMEYHRAYCYLIEAS